MEQVRGDPAGGHINFREAPEQTARRETQEETGVQIADLVFLRTARRDRPGRNLFFLAQKAVWCASRAIGPRPGG